MLSEIPQLSWFFLLLFTLNGLTVILILLLRNSILKSAQFLLAINLLGVTMASIVICLVETRVILKVPFLFRLPSPVYYLMFPAAYLYVKLILTDRVSLRKKEYLHFIPALIHLVEMMPFYLKTNAEKIIRINAVFNNDISIYAHNEGWLPSFFHNIIRALMAIVYAIAMWRILQKSKAKMDLPTKTYFGTTLQWLTIFTLMNGLLGVVILQSMTFTFIPSEIRSLLLHLTFIIILIISNYYLLFQPEILYGLPRKARQKTVKNAINGTITSTMNIQNTISVNSLKENDSKNESAVPILIEEYKTQLNHYILQSQVFLNPDLSIFDLSRDTKIPVHHLRLLINKFEGQRFNDYINHYRMQYMKSLIDNGELVSKTLESLAIECGFSSKPAFIRGVKKLTNQTPGAYFNLRKNLM